MFSLDQISNSWNMDDSGEPSQHPHGRVTSIIYLTRSLSLSLSISASPSFLITVAFDPFALIQTPYRAPSFANHCCNKIMRVNYALFDYYLCNRYLSNLLKTERGTATLALDLTSKRPNHISFTSPVSVSRRE